MFRKRIRHSFVILLKQHFELEHFLSLGNDISKVFPLSFVSIFQSPCETSASLSANFPEMFGPCSLTLHLIPLKVMIAIAAYIPYL